MTRIAGVAPALVLLLIFGTQSGCGESDSQRERLGAPELLDGAVLPHATDATAVGVRYDTGAKESGESPSGGRPRMRDGSAGSILSRGEGRTTLSFMNATSTAGLLEPLDCMMGHAVAFGDSDGDGWPDLFFGTFSDRPDAEYECASGARPNRFFRNDGAGAFVHVSESAAGQYGRSSGAVFADLDGDDDLDLVVTHNAKSSGNARLTLSNLLLRNDGGTFTDVTAPSGLSAEGMAARNVIPLDYDGDGQLDLFVVGDMFGAVGSRLFRNRGGLLFEDRTAAAGLPLESKGLGAAAADVNNDGWPDLFLGHVDQLWVNDGQGSFVHLSDLDSVFAWPAAGSEDWRAGVAFGDVNRDGWLDLVVGHHYDSAWTTPVPVRLYMNRSTPGGPPRFEYATGAGLDPIGAKSPHVEVQDFDNDGWPDIYVSVHVEQPLGAGPLVFQNQRARGENPEFSAGAFTVASGGVQNVGYGAAGATVDFDRDGRLDVFIPEWWPNRDSILYRNTSASGNYLVVAVRGAARVNSMGIGARVDLFETGHLGDAAARIGRCEVMSGYGYSSGQEAACHFGLADRPSADVRVVLPHGGASLDQRGVSANQRLIVH